MLDPHRPLRHTFGSLTGRHESRPANEICELILADVPLEARVKLAHLTAFLGGLRVEAVGGAEHPECRRFDQRERAHPLGVVARSRA